MLIEFQQLDELRVETSIHNRKYPIRVSETDSSEYDFFCCECNHIHGGINHSNSSEYETEPCEFGTKNLPCGCTRFVPKDFWFKIEVRPIDIFSFKNPDLEFDSIYFWDDLKDWIKNYERTRRN